MTTIPPLTISTHTLRVEWSSLVSIGDTIETHEHADEAQARRFKEWAESATGLPPVIVSLRRRVVGDWQPVE